MVGHGGSSAGSYLADPTSPIPSHCASIVVTSTLRVSHITSGLMKKWQWMLPLRKWHIMWTFYYYWICLFSRSLIQITPFPFPNKISHNYQQRMVHPTDTVLLTLTVLVATIDAQWEGKGDVGSVRYEPALLPPCPTIRVLSYSS